MDEHRKGRGISRRQFISAAAAAAGSLALPGCSSSGSVATGADCLPDPEKAGFDHIVVVMMENRSFDHFLGWVPGADGVQAGTRLQDSAGNMLESYDLAPNFQNCQLSEDRKSTRLNSSH